MLRQCSCCCLDCPSSVSVNKSSEQVTEGDVLACTSDGYPEPSYTWTDSNGVVVSTAYTTTLSEGWFNLTCTASGNFAAPCNASYIVSGFAAGKNDKQITTVMIATDRIAAAAHRISHRIHQVAPICTPSNK